MVRILIVCWVMLVTWAVNAANVLSVVTELSPPLQTKTQDGVGGYATHIVKEILSQAKLKADFKIYPWARAFKLASEQKNTLIYAMLRSEERENKFQWIGPVAYYNLSFVRLKEREDIRFVRISDVIKYQVAVQRNDIAHEYLKSLGYENQLLVTSSILESWELLLKGKVDLVIDDPSAFAMSEDAILAKSSGAKSIFPIPALSQKIYLAASNNTHPQIVKRLQEAHKVVARTVYFQQVMASRYEDIQLQE